MISSRICTRLFHWTRPCYAAEKSLLATLRKKTGYTFSNCKKALEIHNNDLKEAEKWLKDQAQTLGWSKATKLEGRQTKQGLVGVVVKGDCGVLVEVNCETDFVARNAEFHKIVTETALSCLKYTEGHPVIDAPVMKRWFDEERIKGLLASDGKSLADHLALTIGSVGENASFRRALSYKIAKDQGILLSGYAHPSGTDVQHVALGRFGGLVALKPLAPLEIDLQVLGKELCQHIVGMNPQKVGEESDEPALDKEEETCLIHQEFLLDDSVHVGEVLQENQVLVLDFKRFECGEVLENDQLDYVETCQ